jgi:nucleotide-binding universal stress UspA family protein
MKKILIPCDFSELSANAIRYGAGLAKHFSAELLLLHVTQFPVINPEVGFAAYTYQDAAKDSLQALQKLATQVRTNEQFTGNIIVQSKMGDITEEVVKYSKDAGADLIIMGITGHASKLMKNVVGSSAVSVSRVCECPLIIVPPKVEFKVPQIMLYACEYEEEVRVHPGFDKVKEMSTLFGAELHVVHVVKEGSKHSKAEHEHTYYEDKTGSSPYRTFLVAEKHASSGLVHFLEQHKTDMIIIEPKKHGWFYEIFHRSVTNEIAFTSPVPVLAMH